MGFNTAAIIRNDYLHDIATDTELGQKLRALVFSDGRAGRDYIDGISVLPSSHADYDQLAVIGQNRIRAFRDLSEEERLAHVRGMADALGYNLRKRSAKPADDGGPR